MATKEERQNHGNVWKQARFHGKAEYRSLRVVTEGTLVGTTLMG